MGDRQGIFSGQALDQWFSALAVSGDHLGSSREPRCPGGTLGGAGGTSPCTEMLQISPSGPEAPSAEARRTGCASSLVHTSRWTPSPGPGEHAPVPASRRDPQRGSPTGKGPCAGLNSMKQGLCCICHCVPSGPAQGLAHTGNSVNTTGVRGVARKERTPPFPPPDCPKPSKVCAADQQCHMTWTRVENTDSQPRLRARTCI